MSRDSWFRNTTWSSDIAEVFEAKLKRARGDDGKAQYLRVQASYLLNSSDQNISAIGEKLMHRVIEEYYDEVISVVQAMQELADFYMDNKSYLKAALYYLKGGNHPLNKRRQYGNSDTPLRYIDAVIKGNLEEEYTKAMKIFNKFPKKSFTFVNDEYLYAKVGAMLNDRIGNRKDAIKFAKIALVKAEITEPEFPKYPNLGSIESTKEEIDELIRISMLPNK